MADEPKRGRESPEPAIHECERSNGRRKLKNKGSDANDFHRQCDTSSNDARRSEPEPASLASALEEKTEEIVEVDESTNRIGIKREGIFGTSNKDSNLALTKQVVGLLPTSAPGKLDSQNVKWALATICGIDPKDELEGLLAAQMVGVHSLAMRCLERPSRENRMDAMDSHINHATKLLRTFTTQIEVLNRHRGKVGQPMVVGNVNVNDGGQAIVGPVRHNGREKASAKNDAGKVE